MHLKEECWSMVKVSASEWTRLVRSKDKKVLDRLGKHAKELVYLETVN